MQCLAAPVALEACACRVSLLRPHKLLSSFRVVVGCDEPEFELDGEVVERCRSVALELEQEGVPIGLQVIAGAYCDLLSIDFVRQLTAELGGFTPPPGYEE